MAIHRERPGAADLAAATCGGCGADEPLTAETEARIRNWLAEHPQDLFALNTYSLDQYGLTVEQLEPIFAEHLDTFDIEMEGTP